MLDRLPLGSHTFPVTAAAPEARRAFNRGLTLAYAFHHGFAEREFRRAARLDPQCAMAWWGVALVNGPHINFPLVPPDKAKVAWGALLKARARAADASELEKSLIDALATRYALPQPENRRPLDEAYAAAMREVWRTHPDSADAATLFAEAMMDLRPWDLWTGDGTPQPGTEEIVATLERAIALNPKHPGALHLYIHAVEASPHPEKAVPAADRLGPLVPGASHLVHMPSHIYARVGRWNDAAVSNERAMAADTVYRAANPRPGFYAMYMAHNDHFFAFAAMMQGRRADALKAARNMVAAVPPEFVKEFAPVVDGYLAFVPEVLMRFGRWEEILREGPPPGGLPLSSALWRFTRAVALTGLGRLADAERERVLFLRAAAKVPREWTFGNNPASAILSIAGHVLDGERAARRGHLDRSIDRLRQAVAVEESLRYDEPPDWIQPVRHTLGAVLLRAGQYRDAEACYRADLTRWPENGWALFGLGRALRRQKRTAEAAAVEARFARAWARADARLVSTCYCQPGV